MTAVSDPSESVDTLLLRSRAKPGDVDAVTALAATALTQNREADALPLVSNAIRIFPNNALLWQWKALLHRAVDQHELALIAFGNAARLRPDNPLITHSLARTTLEAGQPSLALFDRAFALDPMNSDVLLGRAAAYCADGKISQAQEEIDGILKTNPGWLQGHELATKLRWMQGQDSAATETLEIALLQHPRDPSLWTALIGLLSQALAFDDVIAAVARSRAMVGTQYRIDVHEAAALSELKLVEKADAAFARLDTSADISVAVHYVRHLLRNGRIGQAQLVAEPWMTAAAANLMWPYLSLIWRVIGDPRWDWLEGNPDFIRSFDLTDALPSLDGLKTLLQSLHGRSSQPFDQSVRKGLQTDGMLLQRIEPEIAELRMALTEAISTYIAALPPRDAAHPLLQQRRDRPVRFSGAWSVLLRGSGYHANHNHPAGWISSAFYVSVPEKTEGNTQNAGAITFGVPETELDITVPPIRTIQPTNGQLILFPSTMWHGTTAFRSGDRMTVAFDVAEPRP